MVNLASVILVPLLGICFVSLQLCLHQVREGYVGIYWRGGALLPAYSLPGYNLKMPFITSFAEVQTNLQTDQVIDIPCGTSGGVEITFSSIEVVNRLPPEYVLQTVKDYGLHYDKIWIFDKIHHEINQFCSKHTLEEVFISKFGQIDERLGNVLQAECEKYGTGIEIISTRVTKPRVPQTIRQNYESMEVERTNQLVATQHKIVVQKMAETQRRKEMIMAKQLQKVSEIESQTQLLIKRGYKTMEKLEDQIQSSKSKAMSDAEYYKMSKMSEENNLKLTDEYLQLETYQAIGKTPKFFFGDVDEMFNIDNFGEEKTLGIKA